MSGDAVIVASARKHGISDADILHAYSHPARVFILDDGLTMIVGPARSATLLEIGVVAGDEGDVVVHAMPAREKFLR